MEVHLLGPLAVTRDGEPLAVGARKERAVLAALALHAGQVVGVDDLIDALWSNAAPATAEKTLQSYLSKLRRVLGSDTVATRNPGYVLCLPADAIDVHRMQALADQARADAVDGRHHDAVVRYRDALALWNGDPLPDLAGSDLGAREIARLVELRHTIAEELLDARLAIGEHHLAIPNLEALVREAPLRERAWGLLMLALYRAGRQADALRAFQAARARLIDEIGVEPGSALRDLEVAIIAQDPALDLAPTSEAAAGGILDDRLPSSLAWALRADQPFAGRVDELAHIEGAWAATIELGQRHGVLVGGEPGIGKTRLVGEAARVIHEEGGVVLFGSCEDGLGAPYQPFVEALGALVRQAPRAALPGLIGPLGPELTRLLPDLVTLVPDLGWPDTTDSDAGRHRLFEAVTELLERLSARQPVLLVIDDLQWATLPTLLLLRHLLSVSRPARLLVLGTYRTTDLGRIHPLSGILADLRRQVRTSRLTLDGLDRLALITLATRAAHHDLDARSEVALSRLHDLVGGNPFFFWTMLSHLIETGLVVRRSGRWTQAEDAFDAPLPEGIREVVARRLSSLDDATNAALRVAALLGGSFDYRVLAEVVDVADDHVLDILDHGQRAGIVVELSDTFGRFRFTHDIIRRSLAEEVSTTRRARWHWRITEVLQAHEERHGNVPLDELARHATEGALAGDLERACTIVRRAGDAALDALAFEEAAEYYDDALGFVDDANLVRRYELLLGRGSALRRAGNLAYRASIEEAAGVARLLGDAQRMADAVLELHDEADLTITAVNDPSLQVLLREALDGLDDRDVTAGTRARLTSANALAGALSGQRAQAIDLSREAVRLARASHDDHVLAQVLFDHSWVIAGPDTPLDRVAIGTEIVELARRRGDRIGAANGLNCLAKAWLELGDVDAGANAIAEGVALAEELRNPTMAWSFQVLAASLASLQGDVATIDRLAHELLATGTDLGIAPGTLMAVHGRLLLAARYEEGRLDDLEDVIGSIVSDQPELPWLVVLGVVQCESGRTEEARALLDQIRGRTINRDLTWVAVAMLLSIVAAHTAERDLAAQLYRDLLPLAGRNSHDGAATLGPIDLGLGRLAVVLDLADDAARHFADAAALCRSWNAPMWLAHVLVEQAASVVHDDPVSAGTLRDEAGAIAARTGQLRIMHELASEQTVAPAADGALRGATP